MSEEFQISEFVSGWSDSPFGACAHAPRTLIKEIEDLIRAQLTELNPGYNRQADVACHNTAVIEAGAIVKGPA